MDWYGQPVEQAGIAGPFLILIRRIQSVEHDISGLKSSIVVGGASEHSASIIGRIQKALVLGFEKLTEPIHLLHANLCD